MELEDVSEEQIEWEYQRLAAAFGIKEWEESNKLHHSCVGSIGNIPVFFSFNTYLGTFDSIEIGPMGEGCCVFYDDEELANWVGKWFLHRRPEFHESMARGLYRLGFEDESILSQLPLLSAHEKLELRLSLPREFWPQKWLDEKSP